MKKNLSYIRKHNNGTHPTGFSRDLFFRLADWANETLFYSLRDGVAFLNRDMVIQRANPTLERWYPHASPLAGRKCYEAFHSRETPCEACPSLITLRTGQAVTGTAPYLGCQNELLGWLNLFSFPLFDPETGLLEGVIECARDITEQKQHEHEMEAIASIASALRTAVERQEMYPILLAQIEKLLHTQACALVLRVEPNGDEIPASAVVEAANGNWGGLVGTHIHPEASKMNFLLANDQTLCRNHISRDEPLNEYLSAEGLDSIAAVPLGTGGRPTPLGTLWIGRKALISAVEMQVLSAVGSIVANAIQRALLFEQTRRDANTMASVSKIIHTVVRMSALEEIYTRLAKSIQELLPDVAVVIVGLYGEADKPVQWTYAIHNGKVVNPLQVPDLLKTLAGSSTEPPPPEPAGVFSGGKARPQPAVYAPLATKEEVIGELQAYRRDNRPFSVTDQEVLSILASTAAVAIQNTRLYEGLQQSNRELLRAYDVTLESLARALELRDRETEGHTRRVADLSARLASLVGLEGEDIIDLKRGAQLHDIGKMGVPDGILLKTHPLTKEEWVIMRRHTEYAMEVLQPIDYLKGALDIPHYHHEKWDGSGYPQGLKGENIPLAARIFAIVDVWDALISDRPYREAWTRKKAIQYMRSQSGKHFDPHILEYFLDLILQEYDEELVQSGINTSAVIRHARPTV